MSHRDPATPRYTDMAIYRHGGSAVRTDGAAAGTLRLEPGASLRSAFALPRNRPRCSRTAISAFLRRLLRSALQLNRAPKTASAIDSGRAIVVMSFFLALHAPATALGGDATERSGDILRAAVPAAAFALTFIYDDPAGRPQFYRSFGVNVAATLLLKEAVSRDRPNGSDDDAFPSGHASTAFQGASFIHRRYGLKAAWPAYVLATYTGWTRIDADEHDEIDVLAGAALGILSSALFVERFEHVEVALRVDRQIGLQLSGRF